MSHPATTQTLYIAAGQGEQGINNILNNVKSLLLGVGSTLAVVALVVVFILMMVAIFKPNGGVREHIGKIAMVCLACVGLGLAGVLVSIAINTGGEIGNNQQTVQQDGVN
ncbi:hypothetical protein [Gordonia otitidis]|uniref:Uncharacterized protein n=1 Tax=Gordonia otitidis (strain DSM 44809 / CCUG 52243 / JCM 12355 / NBRC 100426 / IFM 10032) TaxID=1108044 RepID=H5TIA9_GORO1|nr:hypothetical protein [Gordonia otitidis]GAB33217.1 hypothetical protein GOOTI_051_00080 [Gordonia otitidis NBRC 100426]